MLNYLWKFVSFGLRFLARISKSFFVEEISAVGRFSLEQLVDILKSRNVQQEIVSQNLRLWFAEVFGHKFCRIMLFSNKLYTNQSQISFNSFITPKCTGKSFCVSSCRFFSAHPTLYFRLCWSSFLLMRTASAGNIKKFGVFIQEISGVFQPPQIHHSGYMCSRTFFLSN